MIDASHNANSTTQSMQKTTISSYDNPSSI